MSFASLFPTAATFLSAIQSLLPSVIKRRAPRDCSRVSARFAPIRPVVSVWLMRTRLKSGESRSIAASNACTVGAWLSTIIRDALAELLSALFNLHRSSGLRLIIRMYYTGMSITAVYDVAQCNRWQEGWCFLLINATGGIDRVGDGDIIAVITSSTCVAHCPGLQ